MEKMDVTFVVEDWIIAGLENGEFLRKGGVIVDGQTHQIIRWLFEAESNLLTEGIPKVFDTFSIAKTSLLITAFVYFQRNFSKINQKLNILNLKIDEQNRAKITSGIDLAVKAENVLDNNNRNNQLIQARSKLSEGRDIYIGLFNNTRKNMKNYIEIVEGYLELIVQSQLIISRTYLLQKDFILAKQTLIELDLFYQMALYKIIDVNLDPLINNTYGVLKKIYFPIKITKDLVMKSNTPERYTLDELNRLNKSNIEERERFNLIIQRAADVDYEFSKQIRELIKFRDFIKGYEIECDHYLRNESSYEKNLALAI